METTLVCSECGKGFERPGARGPIPTRCSDCKTERKREQHATQERKRLARKLRNERGEFVCGRCQQTKPRENFTPSARRDGGWCKECHRASYVEAAGGMLKVSCENCDRIFETTARGSRKKRFCSTSCKRAARQEQLSVEIAESKRDRVCENQNCRKPIPMMRANARWCSNACAIKGRTTPEQRAAWNLSARLRQYGVTAEEYETWMAAGCAICGTHESQDGRAMAIDHCHVSGEPRGVLCGNCNKGLGLFLDRPDLLRQAAMYLEGTGAP